MPETSGPMLSLSHGFECLLGEVIRALPLHIGNKTSKLKSDYSRSFTLKHPFSMYAEAAFSTLTSLKPQLLIPLISLP